MVDNWLSRLASLHNAITNETILLLHFSNERLHFPQKNTNNCQEFSGLEKENIIILFLFKVNQTRINAFITTFNILLLKHMCILLSSCMANKRKLYKNFNIKSR